MGVMNPTAELMQSAQQRATHRVSKLSAGDTHFWHYSAEQESRGTIIFLHGYRGTHEGVEAIVGALSDFEVLVPDLPGYGKSDPLPGQHTVTAYLDWLAEWLVHLDLKTLPLMMGHSFGTVLVAGQASLHPGSAKARILINAVSEPAMQGNKRTLLQLTRLFYRLSNLFSERFAERVLNLRLFVWVMSEVTTKSRERAFGAGFTSSI